MKFNIISFRYFSYGFSLLMLLALIGGAIYKKKTHGRIFLYGVEFIGGVELHCSLSEEGVSAEEMHTLLAHTQPEGAVVRKLSATDFVIRLPHKETVKEDERIGIAKQEVLQAINEKLPSQKVIFTDSAFVGPGVGENLKIKVIISILGALLLMFGYLWLRFRSLAFGIASSFSLAHDVMAIIMMVLFFDYEISLDIIGAILFILGYSINDTIVIFARIRETIEENVAHTNESFATLINASIKNTLRRTILTSTFTALSVIPLWLFGGAVLHALSSAILLGIIFGTYSSIGIACSLLYDCRKFIF